MSPTVRKIISLGNGVFFGVLYGLMMRLIMSNTGPFASWVGTMTLGFLCLVPFAIGALTVYFAPHVQRNSLAFAFFAPWLATALWAGIAALLAWEVWICVVMALPIVLILASIGGVVTYALTRDQERPTSTSTMALALLLILPLVVTPLEMQRAPQESLRHVATAIDIEAPAEVIWQNIVSVPTIQPEEQHFSLFHALGLPQPVAAVISHEGVGGVRDATFEGGLSFVETVTEWQELQQLSFSIKVDGNAIQPAPLNMIGGRYLDILDGTYRLEPLPDGRVRLHLTSDHRLTTHINDYGGFWTDLIMRDLQSYILRIIKARCEQQAG